jgi:hypothetical protein
MDWQSLGGRLFAFLSRRADRVKILPSARLSTTELTARVTWSPSPLCATANPSANRNTATAASVAITSP